MERQFFSGNTMEQAVLAAARHYGLDPSRVAYRLRDKKHGFLNMRRRVVIEVDPAAPEQPEEALQETSPVGQSAPQSESHDSWSSAAPETSAGAEKGTGMTWQGEAEPQTGEDRPDPEIAAFEKAVDELVGFLNTELEATIRRPDEELEIELTGPGSDVLVDQQGRALSAVEHLLPRMVRGLIGRGLPCRVDSGGFRAARELELRQLAEVAAEDARRDRVEKLLEPMNPAERRLVHLALADDPTVRTESEGDGFLKRVRILPA